MKTILELKVDCVCGNSKFYAIQHNPDLEYETTECTKCGRKINRVVGLVSFREGGKYLG